jgi:hypothetical protein
MAELYFAFATLVRRFDLGLHNTTPKDVQVCRDYAIPVAADNHISARLEVTGIVEA